MTEENVILLTMVAYLAVMVLVGVVGARRTGEGGFLLGGRTLSPIVAGISASATSSSVWTLLGVSGYAYQKGLAACWLFPACVGGFALNWFLLAPRLRRLSAAEGALTMADVLAGPEGTRGRMAVRRSAAVVILLCMGTYVASQFQGAGKTFTEVFGLDPGLSILLGAAVVLLYVLIGGFTSISRTNTMQGLAMVLAAVVLPVTALFAVQGPSGLWQEMVADASIPSDGFDGRTGAAAIGFVLGLLGIGLGYPGQPHVVSFLMAVENERALRQARLCALVWACLVYAGMIVVGWCGRVLLPPLADQEGVFLALAGHLLHPVVAGLMTAAILSAILSTVDSLLLTSASAITHDMFGGTRVLVTRLVLVVLCAGAVLAARYGSQEIFSRVLVAWSAMGAAFGPLLLWTVWRGRLPASSMLVVLWVGFAASVVAYSVASTRGTYVERVVPFVLAFLLIALMARRGR